MATFARPVLLWRQRWWLVVLWVAATAADTISTLVALSRPGFYEQNQVPAAVINAIGVRATLAGGVLECLLLALLGLVPARRGVLVLLQRGLVVLAVVKLGVAGHNLWLLSQ